MIMIGDILNFCLSFTRSVLNHCWLLFLQVIQLICLVWCFIPNMFCISNNHCFFLSLIFFCAFGVGEDLVVLALIIALGWNVVNNKTEYGFSLQLYWKHMGRQNPLWYGHFAVQLLQEMVLVICRITRWLLDFFLGKEHIGRCSN